MVGFEFSKLGEFNEQRPYFPFPVAVEKGLIGPDVVAPPSPHDPPGITLSMGRIPNSKQAGLIPVGPDGLVAFDHAAAELQGSRLVITPAAKSAVTREGVVREEGLIVMGNKEGRLKIAAFAIDATSRPWLADRLSRNLKTKSVGRVAVFPAPVLDLPEYEITDIDNRDGIVSAKPRW